MESFVAGQHRYVIPVNPARDADRRGLMGRNWPRAQEVSVDELSGEDIDLDRFLAQWDCVIDECCG
jgi:hypothetical protein